ncbi:DUF1738 domain-containing protein [Desulfopila sp. IMCC35006]|uniref:ArdC family protein n=1 Tax=Desulfopila sp. IMCC35006 TaxID=2569542 RepID=UPI0010AB7C05|nr:ArdC-like ssDNA-binding domain-containing protein [Desulfopila sp. IMCC35006]TKB23464.1 DUF1738 domain-containing protein [Desulfopila sp. IMCC35006]
MGTSKKIDVYEMITNQVLELMESGCIPWQKPWNARGANRNLISGKQYRGINVFLLSCTSFSTPWWLTYKQAADKGGKVRKGEKGTQVVFWKPLLINEENPATGKTEKKKIFMLRYYTIFNLDQVDGIEAPVEPEVVELEPIAAAEKIVTEMQNAPKIEESASGKACYYPQLDKVQMPFFTDFDESEKFYSVLFHELGHSTGHESRVNRPEGMKDIKFGSDNYSKEELTAEMTAAFLCGEAGILPATVENSAAYLQGWSKKFKESAKMIVCAAAAAQKAADYILNVKFNDQD